MGTTFVTNTELTTVNCGECGGVYAILERHRAQCQQKGTGWTCPYCKVDWGFFNNNENARLKRELAEAKRKIEYKDAHLQIMHNENTTLEHRRRAEKAAKTRLKNRVGKGVCPCCNRTFLDLQRHMQLKHPSFAGCPDAAAGEQA